jgi:hypothetical protein
MSYRDQNTFLQNGNSIALVNHRRESNATTKEIAAQVNIALSQAKENRIGNQPKQWDLFWDTEAQVIDPQVIFDNIDGILRTYTIPHTLTAEQYTQILGSFNIPKVVIHSFLAYRKFLIENNDSFGKVKYMLFEWSRLSIENWTRDNKTFSDALKETYKNGKSETQNIWFYDFFRINKIPFLQIGPLIPYLIYRHTWRLPVWKIIKETKS